MSPVRPQRPPRRRRHSRRRAPVRRPADLERPPAKWLRLLLSNPFEQLQISAFVDRNPRGFGLLQRTRDFNRRSATSSSASSGCPSLWARADRRMGRRRGASGRDSDRPPRSTTTSCRSGARARRRAPRANTSYTYRIHWGVARCRSRCRSRRWSRRASASGPDETRLIVIDFAGENFKGMPPADIKATVTFDKGKVRNVVTHPNPEISGIACRLPARTRQREIGRAARPALPRRRCAVSEAWMDRWTP